MKTDMLKTLRRLRLPVLALAAFLASCTSELAHEPVPGGGGSQADAEAAGARRGCGRQDARHHR